MSVIQLRPTWSPYVDDDGPRPQAASVIPPEKSAAAARLRYRAFANFYVALKSCPLIILAGPPGSGKIALARLAAQLLAGDERRASMVGHARWAAGSPNSAMLVEAQARLSKNVLFGLIERAWEADHAHRPFVAYLERISPAELAPFFTAAGLDLLYRQFLGWRETAELPLLPLPPNLMLVATMDTERFHWWDPSLSQSALVVPWPAPVFGAPPSRRVGEVPLLCSGSFLQEAVRSTAAAHIRLRKLFPAGEAPFRTLLALAGTLEDEGVSLPPTLLNRITVFAANAWRGTDHGLFVREPRANLEVAIQLGIIQVILPWLAATDQISRVRASLLPFLDEEYDRLLPVVGWPDQAGRARR